MITCQGGPRVGALVIVALAAGSLALAGCTQPNQAGGAGVPPIPGLDPAAVAVMNAPPYANATWAIQVSDLDTGETLVSSNTAAFLAPGSVTKVYSTAAAWRQFGPQSRIVTPVVRQGKVSDRTLAGNLVLVAKGDITMGGQTGPDGEPVFANFDHNDANAIPGAALTATNPLAGLDRLAKQVRAAGISRVTGQVIVDDRLFQTQDFGVDGPVSPIIINHNLIDVVITPASPGQRPEFRLRPEVAPWTVQNKAITVASGAPTQVSLSSGKRGVITITGTIAADSDPVLQVWHLTDPATFARTAFIEALRRAGVKMIANATTPNSTAGLGSPAQVNAQPVVARLDGLTLAQNVKYILKVSYNRGAQTQICLLAVAAGSTDCDAGMPQAGSVLSRAGIDTKLAALINGSGTTGNLVAARSPVQLMRVFAAVPDAAQWKAALPVMGVDGSLADVQRDSPAKGQVFAKTGTLMSGDLLNERVRLESKALAGYIDARSGRRLAFCIMVNQAMYNDVAGLFAANEDLGKIATSIWARY